MAIRVLVVDDAALVRRRLVEALERHRDLEVVGTAVDGIDALAKIRATSPDVVTLDVMMPRLDGLKVLAHVMRERPVRILMLSSLTHEGADVTLQALELGAVDFVDKTRLGESGPAGDFGEEVARRVRAIAAIDLARLRRPEAAAAEAPPAAEAGEGPGGADLVVIGASTGGPQALQRLLPSIPADLPAGIVVVQHMPAGFTAALAARLDALSPLAVREARPGDAIRPGTALVAPGALHLSVRRGAEGYVADLAADPADAHLRPSVDLAMRSAAAAAGRRAVGVLLTGMGQDGAQGMWSVHAAGGRTLAESEESAVVFGMPRAAIEFGAVDEVLPLERMAARIVAACRPNP